MTRHRLLIVDADEPLRHLLARYLLLRGYRCDSTGSVRDGLALVHAESYGAVLCDYYMPVGNGLDFLKALRASATTRDVPVGIYTSDLALESATCSAIAQHGGWLFCEASIRTAFMRMIELMLTMGHDGERSRSFSPHARTPARPHE